MSRGRGSLFESRDGGESWSRVSETVGLLAWPDWLYLIVGGGQVFASREGGRQLEHLGAIGGQLAALAAEGPRELYVALHDRHDQTLQRLSPR